MQVSKHFTLAELTKSPTAERIKIPNEPPASAFSNLKTLCEKVLEPLREKIGPITINSGYRSPALNKAIGSKPNSQHVLGMAADIESMNMSNEKLGKTIEESGIIFDQLIYEYIDKNDPRAGWIHVSYNPNGDNRKQILYIK